MEGQTRTRTVHLRLAEFARMLFIALLLPCWAFPQVKADEQARNVSISGRLVDRLGNPIESGAVFLTRARSPIVAEGCRVNPNGTFEFRFRAQLPGSYDLHFDVPGFSPRVQTVTANEHPDVGTIALEFAQVESPAELPLHRPEVLNAINRSKRQDQIDKLIDALHSTPWLGAENICSPMCWNFNFTEPMRALLEIGPEAQDSLLSNLSDRVIADQVIILLGGAGDERSIGSIIDVLKSVSSAPPGVRRRRTLTAGNLALTNITVSEVIWHHGGGIPFDACPEDPAGCWYTWWDANRATFRVRDIKTSRRYVNYPNYGIYRGLP